MFEKYTDRARCVLVLTQEESRLLNHNYMGTEHLLLGLAREPEGIAGRALKSLEVGLDVVREQVRELIGQGIEPQSGHIPFTPRAHTALELALQESADRGQDHLDTEHLLLGLVREGQGVGTQILLKLGAGPERVRAEVDRLLGGEGHPPV